MNKNIKKIKIMNSKERISEELTNFKEVTLFN